MAGFIDQAEITGVVQKFADDFLFKHYEIEQDLELKIDYKWNKLKQQPPSRQHSSAQQLYLSQQCISEPTDNKTTFYGLVMMLFPEVSHLSPLGIDIADTLFYLPDNSIIYVFKDAKKGLFKIRNKNINVSQLFLKRICFKRKQKHRQMQKKNELITSVILSCSERTQKTFKDIGCSLGYIALLKYKDESFIRLKQNDFKTIFNNPLHANQKFKNTNNTQYIQNLPTDSVDIGHLKVHFSFQKFQSNPLFQWSIKYLQSQNQFPSHDNQSQIINIIKQCNQQVYLYYFVFEIYAYILIHYGKRLQRGNFHFIPIEHELVLVGIDGLLIVPHEGHYKRIKLFESLKKVQFGWSETKQSNKVFQQNIQTRNQLQKTMEQLFQHTNKQIKEDVTKILKQKIDKIKAVKDKNISNCIFNILHPNTHQNFHDILNNEGKMKQLLKSDVVLSKPKQKLQEIKCNANFFQKSHQI